MTASLISTLLGTAPDQTVLPTTTSAASSLATTADVPTAEFEAFFAEQLAVLDGQQVAGQSALPALTVPAPVLVSPTQAAAESRPEALELSTLPALPAEAAITDRPVAASSQPPDDLLLADTPTQRGTAAPTPSLRELNGDIRLDRARAVIDGVDVTAQRASNRADDAPAPDFARLGATLEAAVRQTSTAETPLASNAGEFVAQGGVSAGANGASPVNAAALVSPLAPVSGLPAEAPTLTSVPSMELTQPFGSERWEQELGTRLHWMADARVGRAELRLNPPELGPLEVSLNVSNDDVSVSFQAQHAATREAVENALPRLREMMAQSGLNLADANVSQQQQQQSQQELANQQGRHDSAGSADGVSGIDDGSGEDAAAAPSSLASTTRAPGLLDAYA